MSQINNIIEEIATARRYTEDLLNHIRPQQWFHQPAEGVTHVAWQVGHLAMAEYGLALKRVRGEKPEDASLISPEFRKMFGKGSVPDPAPEGNPTIDEIRAVFDRVHQQTLNELKGWSESVLDEPVDPRHPMFTTNGGALLWCAHHEFIHAGQIALLRRLLGHEPLR